MLILCLFMPKTFSWIEKIIIYVNPPSQTWNKESLKKRFNSLKNLHFVEDFVKIKKWENKNQKKIIILYYRK